MKLSLNEIAKKIDHALLKPVLTVTEMECGCRLALELGVASVCILPCGIACCAEILKGTDVKASTVVGFPHGTSFESAKLKEAEIALREGAEELDMVVNISDVRSGKLDRVEREIAALIDLAHGACAKVKVIFENCYLEDEQKIRLCRICSDLGADWIKTSTGFGTHGATEHDVRLMRANADQAVQVKAAGGIGDLDALLRFVALGATRIGASRTKDILEEYRRRFSI